MQLVDKYNTRRLLGIFLCLHLLGWTLVPAFIRDNLPLDAIEGTIWGRQLEWGYDKNPYLNGWLTALATHISAQSDWSVYLFSQLFVIACFWSVWRLAREMLPPAYALLSVLVLEGVQYYNFHSIDFNDNTLELGLWALTAYAFYVALRTARPWAWFLTGCFAGLGMMAKYYTLALLAGMGLFLLLNKDNRRTLRTLQPYLGLMGFMSIVLPHLIWLVRHDFITVHYMINRAGHQNSLYYHFYFPAQFIWQQTQAFLPALVLFALLLIGKRPLLAAERLRLAAFDRDFLFYVGLAPFLLTAFLSLLFGIKLRAGWGMPLLSLWGIILVAAIQPRINGTKLRNFFAAVVLIMALLLGGYSLVLLNYDNTSSANFPGKEIARAVTDEWRARYGTQLAYVAGSRWLSGNIGFYSPDHPSVFIEWQHKHAPWINLDELRQKGGVFVWNMSDNEKIPDAIRKRFPQLAELSVREFHWHGKNNAEPVKIGVAILPPAVA